MLTLLFAVFFASSTDVMANFFQLPLMDVLWFFRFFVPLAPIVAYFLTFKICHEMRDAEHIGKRKRALVVSRSAEGEYTTVSSAPRPGRPPRGARRHPGADLHRHHRSGAGHRGRRPPGHPLAGPGTRTPNRRWPWADADPRSVSRSRVEDWAGGSCSATARD